MKKDWPKGILQAISDALVGYLTLQARCGLSPAYSEYLLYDPIVRVCRAPSRSLHVECEVPVNKSKHSRGDYKRVDFCLRKHRYAKRAVLLEVKYLPKVGQTVNVTRDREKLRMALSKNGRGSRAFVLIAGRRQRTSNGGGKEFPIKPKFEECYYETTYKAANTMFGVEVFQVDAPSSHQNKKVIQAKQTN